MLMVLCRFVRPMQPTYEALPLLHSASRNRSDETKYSAVFTYCDKDKRPIADTRSSALPLIALPVQ